MNRFLAGAAMAVCLPVLFAAEQNQLDGNPSIFSVMAAYTFANNAELTTSTADHPLRKAVVEHLSSRKLAVLPDLQKYFAAHRKKDPAGDLAQYLSFALSSGEPPEFRPEYAPNETPPDVQELIGFQALMSRFHTEAGIDGLWRQVQVHYDKEIERYHEPVSRAVLEANAYLRNPTSGYMGRRFFVFVDLLAPANQVHTRSYKDDYFIVVTPSAEPRVRDVRHAYLHYLLDPLATKYAARINKLWPLIDIATGAPALDASYKSDFLLLTTESMIRAIESRLDKAPEAARQALAEGFILTPFFSENLPAYEKQPSAMRLFLPEMLDKMDLAAEAKRLDKVEFSAAAAVRTAPAGPKREEKPPSLAESELSNAENLYSARELEPARKKFLDVLRLTEDKTVHARSYYGLARIAVLEKNLDNAEQLFRRTLELIPDPHTRSWSEVYLGRLYENSKTPDQALQHYKAALAVEGAPPGARKAAEEGVKKFANNN